MELLKMMSKAEQKNNVNPVTGKIPPSPPAHHPKAKVT
jgi:hypothetical protein